jgi:hypothetical protein
MYEQDKQQRLLDAFTDYYEIASGYIHDEYLKRADGIIDCPFDEANGVDGADTYHGRLQEQLDKLAGLARDLRITIFDTTKH